MRLRDKFGIGPGAGSGEGVRPEAGVPIHLSSRARTPGAAASAAGPARAPGQGEFNRISNGLNELLWKLEGLKRGALLGLGPAWQTTLNFFIERGFRVSSEDILRAWKVFLAEEETRLRQDFAASESMEMTPSGRAARFLKENLQYPRSSFDAVLLWDLVDYLE